jgi:DNA (cytosine-5)-methyltransferase 1
MVLMSKSDHGTNPLQGTQTQRTRTMSGMHQARMGNVGIAVETPTSQCGDRAAEATDLGAVVGAWRATHLDIFSGIGGFALGFEQEGFAPDAFVEIDSGCRIVLGRHWPEVPIYEDISAYSGLPVSGHLGRGQADRSQRLAELIAVPPDWIVVENTQHRWRAWVPELRRCLYTIGYASVCLQLSAAEVGARHERRRAFVIAHADSEQLWKLSRWWRGPGRQMADELAITWDSAPRGLGADDGLPDWVDRRHALGNAVCPPVAWLIARAIRLTYEMRD